MLRAFVFVGCLASATLLVAQSQVQVQPPWPEGAPTFRLFFLGHEIGAEHDQRSSRIMDSFQANASGKPDDNKTDILNSFFRFTDRGTTVEL